MKKPLITALYLPQFHTFPENDEWWGKGFTEWTNVRKARPLYAGHNQPRVPIHDYGNGPYYDLSNPDIIPAQMQLAKKYGIDAFCFYHYWFKGGRKLLHKPLENLLNVEDKLPIQFFLCWANEPWTRTWDGNAGAEHILMEQNYGREEDWKVHFDYLLNFFRREEYTKIENKPVIAIYKATDIPCYLQMLLSWRQLAIRAGYDGIYVLVTRRMPYHLDFPLIGDEVYDFEPFSTKNLLQPAEMASIIKTEKAFDLPQSYQLMDYEKFCAYMTERPVLPNMRVNLGIFPGWDNSPRVDSRASIFFYNNSPEVFRKYFQIQYERSREAENNFFFINAWNEWGEGALLEPDKTNGYACLQAIKDTVHEC